MQKDKNERLIYSPSDLINFMISSFITWVDRYNLEHPNQKIKFDESIVQKLLKNKGNQHEKNYLEKLKAETQDILELTMNNNYKDTIKAMRKGVAIIYQAHLQTSDGIFKGYADFLVKVEGKSKLGNYYYEPQDTKLALKTKPYFIIQLCVYAEMLEVIQGVLPKQIHIILGNKEKQTFRLDDYYDYYKQLKQSFLDQQNTFNSMKMPNLIGIENYEKYASYAAKILQEQDHLSLVANINKAQIKKLHKAGITTLTQLAHTSSLNDSKINLKTFQTLQKQALIQLLSRGKSIPNYEIIQPQEDDPRKGLALLPPASSNDVWFDMEGYPLVNGGLEYLFGVSYLDDQGQLVFKDWWAHDKDQEKIAFQSFIDWVYTRWENDPNMHIYHYAPYEVTALKRLMGIHGVCEEKIDNLLRGQVFIDLCKIVREGLRVGESGYSLKNIEHLYYQNSRNTEVKNATDSIDCYERWLEDKDGSDWHNSILLAQIRDYNKDDCNSTKLLCDWLRFEQIKANIKYLKQEKSQDNKEIDNSVADKKLDLSKNLAEEILNDLQSENYLSQEQKKLGSVIVHLLEYHKREEKSVWWAFYDRLAMTETELINDSNCLGGLVRSETPATRIKSSYVYEYKFETKQETQLEAGNSCYYISGVTSKSSTIEFIDKEHGIVGIKLGNSHNEPPYALHLIPNETGPSAETITKAIYETALQWKKTNLLPQALEDFLLRSKPRIDGHITKNIINNDKSLDDELCSVISNMNHTTLCIQGPPGSGKTSKSAHVIATLLSQGKTVGITSNGHKTIAHLIDKVMQNSLVQKNLKIRAVKIQSKENDFHVKDERVEKGNNKVFESMTYNLIGGTAWAFSNQLAEGKLDYLFIDEAGQVPIANLFGMARSTKNIILIGDQMQLSQPIKGSHPGESGKSCLQYLLQEHQSIPSDLGVFLDKTFRLHPDLCEIISNAFYDDRLKADDITKKRQIIVTEKNHSLINKNSGIIFIPVEHEDNRQSSDEEVMVVNQIIDILLQSKIKNNQISTAITLNDILIISPYNIQVSKIEKSRAGIKVGSVDKLQGQEAPIVILSMCASNAHDSIRGLEFILSKNRMNVALSRAQALAIVVGSPKLASTSCTSVKQMELVNFYCRLVRLTKPKEIKQSILNNYPSLFSKILSYFLCKQE